MDEPIKLTAADVLAMKEALATATVCCAGCNRRVSSYDCYLRIGSEPLDFLCRSCGELFNQRN